MKHAINILKNEVKVYEMNLKNAKSINDTRTIKKIDEILYQLRFAINTLSPDECHKALIKSMNLKK